MQKAMAGSVLLAALFAGAETDIWEFYSEEDGGLNIEITTSDRPSVVMGLYCWPDALFGKVQGREGSTRTFGYAAIEHDHVKLWVDTLVSAVDKGLPRALIGNPNYPETGFGFVVPTRSFKSAWKRFRESCAKIYLHDDGFRELLTPGDTE